MNETPTIPHDADGANKKIEEGMDLFAEAAVIIKDTTKPLWMRKRQVLKIVKTDNMLRKIMAQNNIDDV